MKVLQKNEGYALVIAILLLVLFLMFGSTLGFLFLTEVRTTTSNLQRRQAYFHAVAGAEAEEDLIYNDDNSDNNGKKYFKDDIGSCEDLNNASEGASYDGDESTGFVRIGDDNCIEITIDTNGPPYRIIE